MRIEELKGLAFATLLDLVSDRFLKIGRLLEVAPASHWRHGGGPR